MIAETLPQEDGAEAFTAPDKAIKGEGSGKGKGKSDGEAAPMLAEVVVANEVGKAPEKERLPPLSLTLDNVSLR
jgi:hypothetical protein